MAKIEKEMFPFPGEKTLERSGYNWLRDYEWIEEYFQTKGIQAELEDLKKSKTRTERLPPTKAELPKIARALYDEYLVQRQGKIQKAFMNSTPGHNPLLRLTDHGQLFGDKVGTRPFLSFVSWEEIEQAIKAMPEDPAAITEHRRKATLDHINQRTKKLEAELEKIFPRNCRFRLNAEGRDVRDDLVALWVRIQKQCDGPVSPTGMHLQYSPPAEQAAHEKLRICEFVNPDAPHQPRNQT